MKGSNKPGTLTFAKTDSPNTRSTQIFINLGDNSFLDAKGFSPFGTITSGMDVVQKIYSGYGDAPTDKQQEITEQGKAYLDKNFPKLDVIKATIITSPEQTAPAHHTAAAPAAKKPAASAPSNQ